MKLYSYLFAPLLILCCSCSQESEPYEQRAVSYDTEVREPLVESAPDAAEDQMMERHETRREREIHAAGDQLVNQTAEDLHSALGAFTKYDQAMQEESKMITEKIRSDPNWPTIYEQLFKQCMDDGFDEEAECKRKAETKADRDVFR